MAPTVQDGKVYVGSDDGTVYCLNATNAALVWKYTPAGTTNYLVANDGNFISPYAIRSSVAVDQGVAYFTAGFFPHEGVSLCAVDAATGTQTSSSHWQRKVGGTGRLAGLSPAERDPDLHAGQPQHAVLLRPRHRFDVGPVRRRDGHVRLARGKFLLFRSGRARAADRSPKAAWWATPLLHTTMAMRSS